MIMKQCRTMITLMDLNYSPCVAVFPIGLYRLSLLTSLRYIRGNHCIDGRYYVTLIYVLAKSQDRNLPKVNNYPLLILRCTRSGRENYRYIIEL